MSASQVDPHDKMRSRDVNKVAKGEQAPRPAHEPGTVSRPPPPKQVDKELSKSKGSAHSDDRKSAEQDKRSDGSEEEMVDLETAPADMRFPFTNQTRHCYARYLEYHRCSAFKRRARMRRNARNSRDIISHYVLLNGLRGGMSKGNMEHSLVQSKGAGLHECECLWHASGRIEEE